MKLELQITETIPEDIEEGILYVSFAYWTTAHKCGCGCGQKVVLRLSPKHWSISLNGESVSMYPSVGNWQLPCRSHYWIEEGCIVPASRWTDKEILQNRALTKGRRTPFQTPRARLYSASRPRDSLDGRSQQILLDQGISAGGDTADFCTVPAGLDKHGSRAGLRQWWKSARNNAHHIWRKVIDRIGNPRVS